jgi:hypothetical protein
MLVPFVLGPNLYFVIAESGVAILASIIDATTFYLDRNNVRGTVIVRASGLRIEIDPAYLGKARSHDVI